MLIRMKYKKTYSIAKKLEEQAKLEIMLILIAIWLQISLNDRTVGYVDWALSMSGIHEGLTTVIQESRKRVSYVCPYTAGNFPGICITSSIQIGYSRRLSLVLATYDQMRDQYSIHTGCCTFVSISNTWKGFMFPAYFLSYKIHNDPVWPCIVLERVLHCIFIVTGNILSINESMRYVFPDNKRGLLILFTCADARDIGKSNKTMP
jgi:hypothetical protein